MPDQKEFKYPKVPSQFLGKEINLVHLDRLEVTPARVDKIDLPFIHVLVPQEDGEELHLHIRRADGTLFGSDQQNYPYYEHVQFPPDILSIINRETMIGQNVGILYGQKEVYGRACIINVDAYEVVAWIAPNYSPRSGYARYDRISGEEIWPKKWSTKIDWIGMGRINDIHGIPNDAEIRSALKTLDGIVDKATRPKTLKAKKKRVTTGHVSKTTNRADNTCSGD